MIYKIPVLLFFLLFCIGVMGQTKYSKVSVNPHMKNTFSFADRWSYSWEVYYDQERGVFYRNDGEPVVETDTLPIYFTADCTTNVQGGYAIRHSHARISNDSLFIIFADGLPAYASEFIVTVKGGNFYFEPKIVYPYVSVNRPSYRVLRQWLILNRSKYDPGDTMMGSIRVRFKEEGKIGGKKYFLKGNFKTIVEKAVITDK